ncbi:MAG TPA: FAD-dependent monooxygenase [Bryobacteraceae bacterium]|nr:FAD-dependent monooxygenase [Bryobacteraceae bacterium]
MNTIQIVGAGPAGSAAALAALGEGSAVHIVDRARATRHKVCGEFLAAEACHQLEALGVWQAFLGCEPSRIRRAELHFGSRVKRWNLPETAFGLSRRALDGLLLERAVSRGAAVSRGVSWPGGEVHGRMVLACGRRSTSSRKPRLFGFKAHFEGPVNDAVELYFAGASYAGVSAVENNFTNVCGIAPEDELRKAGFEIDEFLARSAPLAERLRPLTRRMEWLTTGPLNFSRLTAPFANAYPAGDALGFVDPFTGSGILNALATGRRAGRAAARQSPVETYFRECRELLERPVAVSALFRTMIRSGWAGLLAGLVPGRWMYRLTRVPRFLN